MVDLGATKSSSGIDIVRNRAACTIALHQGRYIEGILEDFGMHDVNGHDISLESTVRFCASGDELPNAAEKVCYQSTYCWKDHVRYDGYPSRSRLCSVHA